MRRTILFAALTLLTQGALADSTGRCVYNHDPRTKTITKECDGASAGLRLTKEETDSLNSGRARTCIIERQAKTKEQKGSHRRECR